jgi:hypothetical protein
MDASLARRLTGWLFVSGCASNQARFDAIVLLSVSRGVMLQRIGKRSTNPFRKDAQEPQRILAGLEARSRFCRPPRRLRCDDDPRNVG